MVQKILKDNYGRVLTSLRIQLNSTCNFNCFFCHREGTGQTSKELSIEDIEKIAKAASGYGITKIKLTGGEPTLRRDLLEVVRTLKKYVKEGSMTTHGTMLPKIAKDLKEAGLDRVNISLHAITKDTFKLITGVDFLERVLEAIDAANSAGLQVKIDFVVLKGVNTDQIDAMLEFAASKNAILQLIEYETSVEGEKSAEYIKYHQDLSEIEKEISSKALAVERNELHNRPRYTIMTAKGLVKVEFVMPMHNPDFCAHCNRLRVTSDGYFKTCLWKPARILIKGADEASIGALLEKASLEREHYWK